MYREDVIVQDFRLAASGRIAASLLNLVNRVTPTHFDCAVAYATAPGCKYLAYSFEDTEWSHVQKRWLVSIDAGRTQPKALESLSTFANSEVRIPNGGVVVGRKGFMPDYFFHPKVFCLKSLENGRLRALGTLVGSANLTLGGLASSTEVSVSRMWLPPFTSSERASLAAVVQSHEFFEQWWEQADPLDKVLDAYKARWKTQRIRIPEEDIEETFDAIPELQPEQVAFLTNADALWVEVGTLYQNRGPGKQAIRSICREEQEYSLAFHQTMFLRIPYTVS